MCLLFSHFSFGLVVLHFLQSLIQTWDHSCVACVFGEKTKFSILVSCNGATQKCEEFPDFMNICFTHQDTDKRLKPLLSFPPRLEVPASV